MTLDTRAGNTTMSRIGVAARSSTARALLETSVRDREWLRRPEVRERAHGVRLKLRRGCRQQLVDGYQLVRQ